MDQENILKGLNSSQSQAVTHMGSPLLVLAGAGSGKTKVLTHRIANMLASGIHSGAILAVTFTNKAAKEMKSRIENLVGPDAAKYAWVGTFHSVCARILRQDIEKLSITAPDGTKRRWTKNFNIFDETDTVNVVKQCIKSLDLDPKIYNPKTIRYRISECKNLKKMARDFAQGAINYREERVASIYEKYEELMCRNNALDFDDLLIHSVLLLQQNEQVRDYYHQRFKHILVDEYQDTNHVQYELVRLMVEGCLKDKRDGAEFLNEIVAKTRSVTVVGDVDQSIYSWRGADFKIMIGFQGDYPEASQITLQENYRSHANILKVADQIIANNTERIEKSFVATKSDGDKIRVFEAQDELEEAQFITAEIQRLVSEGKSPSKMAILYRTNVQSRAIEEALLRRNIPYVIVGGFRFYDRKEIKDMISYLKVLHNPADGQSVKRIINEPRRGIGATTIAKIEDYAAQHSFSFYRTLVEIDEVDTISASAKKKIQSFVDLIEELRLAEKSLGLGDLMDEIATKTDYIKMLQEASDAESESRIENIHELIGVATDFELNSEDNSMSAFLSEISLLSEMENTKDLAKTVTMMTLHAAKGLEFEVVFIGGMEEGVLPHQRSLDGKDSSQLEEERRLMYVGVTRAEEKLYLTHARRRRIFGQSEFAIPSRFLEEAPRELLQGYYGQSSSNDRQSSFKKDGGDNDWADDTSHWDEYGSSPKIKVRRAEHSQEMHRVEFAVGDTVKHGSFGTGKVLQIMGSGEKVLYNIDFEGRKKLLDPRFAKLIKI